jgi:hypothetical protein
MRPGPFWVIRAGLRRCCNDNIPSRADVSYGQKIGTVEEPVLHRAIELAEAPELGRRVAKQLPRLPRSPNRSAQNRKITLFDHTGSRSSQGRAVLPADRPQSRTKQEYGNGDRQARSGATILAVVRHTNEITEGFGAAARQSVDGVHTDSPRSRGGRTASGTRAQKERRSSVED